MRILIAEDDVANAKFLSKYLSKFGEVVITPDGIAAVDEVCKTPGKRRKLRTCMSGYYDAKD